jgi:hypothetical protein
VERRVERVGQSEAGGHVTNNDSRVLVFVMLSPDTLTHKGNLNKL